MLYMLSVRGYTYILYMNLMVFTYVNVYIDVYMFMCVYVFEIYV